MNDQNEPAQLRFLEETAIRLRQNGFTVEPLPHHRQGQRAVPPGERGQYPSAGRFAGGDRHR